MVRNTYKDRLFRKLFGDPANKENLLSLYNALNDRNYTDPDELEITTIEDVIYMGIKNDVSCIVDDYMCLIEHQSTDDPNMPLRGYMYFAKLYDKYLASFGYKLSGRRMIKIPTPQYFVLYNGTKEMPDRKEMKLSDAFQHPDDTGGFEWTATLININHGRNKELMKACRVLEEYSMCIAEVREELKETKDAEESITRAINNCIEKGILKDFLTSHKAEVIGMFLTEYNEEEAKKCMQEEYYEDGLAEGIAKGRAEGIAKGRAEGHAEGLENGIMQEKWKFVKNLIIAGMADENICRYVECTQELVDEVRRAMGESITDVKCDK